MEFFYVMGGIIALAGAITASFFRKGAIYNPIDPNLPLEPTTSTTPPVLPNPTETTPYEPPRALELYYESKPFVLTQKWGVYDPKTYRKYGYDRHSGIDIQHGINGRIRAPFDYEIYRTLWQPSGGGRVLSIISKNEYQAPDGQQAHVLVDYLHLSAYKQTEGEGKCGALICIAGNTGVTTGPHVHISYRWVREIDGDWKDVEKNEANNTFDPMPFYNGKYAADLSTLSAS